MSYLSEVLADGPTAVWMLDEASGATAVDSSGNGHDATFSAIDTYRIAGPSSAVPYGVKLVSGSSSHVALPAAGVAVDATNGFSVAGWAWIDAFATWARILDLGNGSATNNLVVVPQDDNGNTAGIVFNGGSSSRAAASRMGSGAWHHLAWTVSIAGDQTLYLDSSQVASVTGGQAPSTGTRGFAYLGRSDWADPYLDGRLAGFATFPKVLSAARVLAQYQAGLPPALAGSAGGLATVVGALSRTTSMAGSVAGHATVAAALGQLKGLAGLAAGHATATVDVSLYVQSGPLGVVGQSTVEVDGSLVQVGIPTRVLRQRLAALQALDVTGDLLTTV